MAGTDPKATIDRVAELMDEFRLSEARLQQGDLAVTFRRRPSPRTESAEDADLQTGYAIETPPPAATPVATKRGMPVTSPMNGIYYGSPNPGSPPFVREGDSVSAGQVIGLIEAMKVFNEIPCPFSGTVIEIVAQTTQIVNPGDILLYVE